MFTELVERIDHTLAYENHAVVGISGIGGAGKTTLSNKLRDHYGIRDERVVRLDNIFAANHAGKPIFEDYDWPVIISLLQRIDRGDSLRYQGRGFMGEELQFDSPLPKVVIIEGVRLFKPDVMRYFNVAVWISCAYDVATARGMQRDKANGADAGHLERWNTEWLPKDMEYIEKYNPEKLANFIFK